MDEDEDEFSRFVRARSSELQRMAWLLTGDWSLAQDLVQSSLAKTWRHWRSINRRDAPEAYARRVLMTTFLAWRRRRWVGELPTASSSQEVNHLDIASEVAQRAAVVAALRRLPERQRAVVVLRYFADLSEQATAEALRCSVGTVKSQSSRALTSLRSNGALRDATIERNR